MEEVKYTKKIVPPDGGWGYVCVVGMILCMMLFGLTVRAFGIIYIMLLERFHTTATIAALVGAVNILAWGFFGPVSSLICTRFSCRLSVTIGSVLQCLGFILTGLVTDVLYVFLTFGLVVGIGMSMCTTASYLIVSQYFDKRRALATSMGSCGGALALFIIPPMIQYITEQYSFSGSMLIIGGFCLHGLIGAALFRPVPTIRVPVHLSQHRTHIFCDHSNAPLQNNQQGLDIQCKEVPKEIRYDMQVPKEICQDIQVQNKEHQNRPYADMNSASNCRENTFSSCNKCSNLIDGSNEDENRESERFLKLKDEQEFENTCEKISMKSVSLNSLNKSNLDKMNTSPITSQIISQEQSANQDLSLQQSNFPGILMEHDIPESAKKQSGVMSSILKCGTIEVLMSNPVVGFVLLVNFGCAVHSASMSAFTPSLALENTDASEPLAYWMISYSGVADAVGKCGVGFLMDLPHLRRHLLVIYWLCSCVSSICCVLTPVVPRYAYYSLMWVLNGLFLGVVFAQRTTVLVHVVGVKKMPLVFGLVLMANSVGIIVGRALGGILRDATGIYDYVYYVTGSLSFLCSLAFLVAVIRNRKT